MMDVRERMILRDAFNQLDQRVREIVKSAPNGTIELEARRLMHKICETYYELAGI